MTKKIFITTLLLFAMATLFQGCGTISNSITKEWPKDQRPVFLWNAPADVIVEAKGVQLKIENTDYVQYKGTYNSKISLPSIFLPFKEGEMEIKISSASMGKTATLKMKPKLYGWSSLGNCCLGPPVGFIVDYITKCDRTMKPRVIDVTACLNGQDKSSWGKP